MKILVVSHHLPPNYRAGAELYALRQALWLQNKGYTVQAIAVEDIEAKVPKLQVKIDTYSGLTINRLYFNRQSYSNVLEASHNNPEISEWMAHFLGEFRPDLMLVNSCYLLGIGILEVARKIGVPVVLTLHDFWFLCQRITLMRPDGALCDGNVSAAECALCLSKDKRSVLWMDKLTGGLAGRTIVAGAESNLEPFKWLLGGDKKIETLANRRERLAKALQGVNLIIAPSQHLKKVFEENGFPTDRIYYCRYGLDSERLSYIEQERLKILSSEDTNLGKAKRKGLKIGYLGQILPHKGVDILIQAFRLIVDDSIELNIYGAMGRNETYDRKLKKLARSDKRIKFAGSYNSSELPNILLGLDLIVVPSIWLENSPLVIMEAQAAGLPVIATNLGGMAEMVQHNQNGLLFERKDEKDLANQIRRLLTEPNLLQQLKTTSLPVKSLDQEFAELLPLYLDTIQSLKVIT